MNFDIKDESFDIFPELEVSRIINNNSNKIYTNKNYDNPYSYDLMVFDKELNLHIGFIEVEKSNYTFLGGKNWYHSFLKRKILIWDNINNCFSNILKDDADKTIYFKFNRNYGFNDCICCDINTISQFPSDYQNKTEKDYQNMVFRTIIEDKRVKVGLDNCIRYIENFFIGRNIK